MLRRLKSFVKVHSEPTKIILGSTFAALMLVIYHQLIVVLHAGLATTIWLGILATVSLMMNRADAEIEETAGSMVITLVYAASPLLAFWTNTLVEPRFPAFRGFYLCNPFHLYWMLPITCIQYTIYSTGYTLIGNRMWKVKFSGLLKP